MPNSVHSVLISGFSSEPLSQKIADHMGAPLLQVERKQHDDFEIGAAIKENLRGRHVVVIASGAGEPNKQEKEARLLMRAANEAGARSVTLVLPYMWYGRSDDIWDERQTPALVDTIETLREHCDDVVVVDPHNANLTRTTFTGGRRVKTCSTVHMAYPFAVKLKQLFNEQAIDKDRLLFMHADAGGVKRISRSFRACMQNTLGLPGNPDQDDWPMGIKDRDKATGKSYYKGISADVAGKDVVVFEDMIASGGTACELAALLKSQGARSVTLCATSGLFTPKYQDGERGTESIERINNSEIDRVIIADTYDYANTRDDMRAAIDASSKIEVIPTAEYLGWILQAVHMEPQTDEITDDNSISAILKGTHPNQKAPSAEVA